MPSLYIALLRHISIHRLPLPHPGTLCRRQSDIATVEYQEGSPGEPLEQFCRSDVPCILLATTGDRILEQLLAHSVAHTPVCVVCVVDTRARCVQQLLSHIMLMRVQPQVKLTASHHLLYASGDLLSSLKRNASKMLEISKVARYAENHSECRVWLLSR